MAVRNLTAAAPAVQEIKPAKLRDGEWGVRIVGGDDHAGRSGEEVLVTTSKGRTFKKVLGRQLATDATSTLYAEMGAKLIPEVPPTAEFEYRNSAGELMGEVAMYEEAGAYVVAFQRVAGRKAQTVFTFESGEALREMLDDFAAVLPAAPAPRKAARR